MTRSGTADGVVRNGDADWVYEEEILAGTGAIGPGRHCHSALPSAVVGCHSAGICTVILLPLLAFSVKMTAPPRGWPGAMYFSPLTMALAFLRFDDSAVTTYDYTYYGEVYPDTLRIRYPKPGYANPSVSLPPRFGPPETALGAKKCLLLL